MKYFSFDRFIQEIMNDIEDFHPKQGKKIGILWFVKQFDNLAKLAETIFESAERRVDLNRAYTKLLQAVMAGIDRCAQESNKTPPDVIRFQNYHAIFSLLSSLKIESLINERKEAKKLYQQYLETYAQEFLGKPLEKISNFFDGVTKEIESGRRDSEVQFQNIYNKGAFYFDTNIHNVNSSMTLNGQPRRTGSDPKFSPTDFKRTARS